VKAVKKKKQSGRGQCHQCTGLCCRYFALAIETPEDWDDFDNIRWYLSHENVAVFVEDGDWYLNILTPCKYLDSAHRCTNYDLRPAICRGYKTHNCEITSDEYDYQLHFTDDKQMEEYMRIKFGANVFDKLEKKKKKPRKAKP